MRMVKCHNCGGRGEKATKYSSIFTRTCSVCHGVGKVAAPKDR